MNMEGKLEKNPKPIDPKEHHYRIVGDERAAKKALLLKEGLTESEAEIQLLSEEVAVDLNFLEDEKKKK